MYIHRCVLTECKLLYELGIHTGALCCIVELSDEVCISHTKHVGSRNKEVIQLQFAECCSLVKFLLNCLKLILEEATWQTKLEIAAQDQNAAIPQHSWIQCHFQNVAVPA